MTQIEKQNLNMIERIRKALDIIQIRLPLKAEEFFNTLNELTDCEIEYDITPKVELEVKIAKNIEFRVYHVRDKVYCLDKEFTVKANIVDVFDSYKTISVVFRYDVMDIVGDLNE
jgi:hypothetical protein